MSLEQIDLDPYFLAKIFTQPIIPGERPAAAATEKVVPQVKYLGENQKNIAIFIKNENEAYLNEELFNLLTNILNACKLSMQDVSLINIAHYPGLEFSDWQKAINIRQAVCFGISPEQIGLTDIPTYQLVAVNNTTLIFSDSLVEIGADKALKARLWNGLKQLLGI
ncbi:hypothetical protein SAMN05660909_01577 [Chitinophaga terrae (ex Kim and Jung 2007)]|uniref:Uncharacterized protein n=1 Tax=Chitinophaga terrae (ex Kim and Jung 2007) TaxID=408074 RepID=A0A1H4AB65_9BACT|nr:hypothetical protein [Chitinophaga terrae (ex Kim and Jung 2007)]MDQ0105922.1 hypothetical protein [Chitinophaga terrae (ex Kim and Jung 2007)]SEA33150.1 hypothetical protein SAMN05660909_01577 [Chitinophaga terrae (ex Kim and Jung 2007)]